MIMMVSSRVSEILWSNRICMTRQHCCTHEFTVAVTIYEVLKRNMSAKSPTWKGERIMHFHLQLRNSQHLIAVGWVGASCLQGCGPKVVIRAPIDRPTLMYIKQHKVDSVRIKKKGSMNKIVREVLVVMRGGVRGKGMRGMFVPNMLYVYLTIK